MILVIDNYDSYVYNLVQYFGADGHDVRVRRNDEVSVDEIRELAPDLVVISPGPGAPEHAGVSVSVVRELGAYLPIFGVCLGHQAIGHAFGATIRHANQPMHGRLSLVHHDGQGLFAGLPNPMEVVRYHSLAISGPVPPWLRVTARADDGEIMAVRHSTLPIESVQFHPESVFTPDGALLVRNAARLGRSVAPVLGGHRTAMPGVVRAIA